MLVDKVSLGLALMGGGSDGSNNGTMTVCMWLACVSLKFSRCIKPAAATVDY
jgi:hypothetical protein